MLRKLFKYEIKATARIFLPLYLVLLAYSVIHKGISFISPHKWAIPEVISMIVYIMVLVGIFVMTIVVIIQRFYKNLLTDEGYLMFTLPTKPWKHITSKLAISMMWTAVSGIVVIMSICIIAFKEIFSGDFIQNIMDAIGKFFDYLGASSAIIIVEFLLLTILSLASNVLIIYASIAVGQLFNRHRILSSLGAFIVLNAVSQILLTIVTIIASIPFLGKPGAEIEYFATNSFHLIVAYMIVFSGILSTGYFILTNYILSRRLNLE